jgi:hypothetical protein
MQKTLDGNGTITGVTKETLSSIKLEKNSKGYNFEIRLDFDANEEGAADKTLAELKRLNDKMTQQYGGVSG